MRARTRTRFGMATVLEAASRLDRSSRVSLFYTAEGGCAAGFQPATVFSAHPKPQAEQVSHAPPKQASLEIGAASTARYGMAIVLEAASLLDREQSGLKMRGEGSCWAGDVTPLGKRRQPARASPGQNWAAGPRAAMGETHLVPPLGGVEAQQIGPKYQ